MNVGSGTFNKKVSVWRENDGVGTLSCTGGSGCLNMVDNDAMTDFYGGSSLSVDFDCINFHEIVWWAHSGAPTQSSYQGVCLYVDDAKVHCWSDTRVTSDYDRLVGSNKGQMMKGVSKVELRWPEGSVSEVSQLRVRYEGCDPVTPAPVYTNAPTEAPTDAPTAPPTEPPTAAPTYPPTEAPTAPPTAPPTEPPTAPPTEPPTAAPTYAPTEAPTAPPTEPPTYPPTEAPTAPPTAPPTEAPTNAPTDPPTDAPTAPSTDAPTQPPMYTDAPTTAEPKPNNSYGSGVDSDVWQPANVGAPGPIGPKPDVVEDPRPPGYQGPGINGNGLDGMNVGS